MSKHVLEKIHTDWNFLKFLLYSSLTNDQSPISDNSIIFKLTKNPWYFQYDQTRLSNYVKIQNYCCCCHDIECLFSAPVSCRPSIETNIERSRNRLETGGLEMRLILTVYTLLLHQPNTIHGCIFLPSLSNGISRYPCFSRISPKICHIFSYH